MNTIVIIGLVIVFALGLLVGQHFGWKAGALDNAQWGAMPFKVAGEVIANEKLHDGLQKLLEELRREPHKSVRERLEEDMEFQGQLAEQDENGNK